MPKKGKDAGKLHEDANEIAFRTVQAAIGEAEKPIPPEERTEADRDPEAVERGRKGGEKGGKARADALSSDQRREIAETAASARWRKTDSSDGSSDDSEDD